MGGWEVALGVAHLGAQLEEGNWQVASQAPEEGGEEQHELEAIVEAESWGCMLVEEDIQELVGGCWVVEMMLGEVGQVAEG